MIQYKARVQYSERGLGEISEGLRGVGGFGGRTPGLRRGLLGLSAHNVVQKKKKKVIRRRAHLPYLRLCPNKHIIANISAELQEEYPRDWLCIYTPLAEREQGRLP